MIPYQTADEKVKLPKRSSKGSYHDNASIAKRGFVPSATDRMKMLDWLVGYRKDWLSPDIIAGLIAAAVVIPKAMAYATVAGLPVQAGLYTALVPLVIYAVLGSSRVLSVSTTTTIAILTGANLALSSPTAIRRCCCGLRPRWL